jgi:hypothetical protein
MPNYQVWNKHGEVDENEPTQVSMHSIQENMHEIVEETTILETVEVTGHESVNETMQETLVADDVVDALDQMTHDGEPDFLDEKNLMKLEQMRMDAKTPLHPT